MNRAPAVAERPAADTTQCGHDLGRNGQCHLLRTVGAQVEARRRMQDSTVGI